MSNALRALRVCVRASMLAAAILSTSNTQAQEISDPTRPPIALTSKSATSTGVQAKPWVLHSTRISKTDRVALINGNVVSIGSRVDGAEVLDIQSGRVRLLQNAQTFTLQLDRPSVKSPAVSGERR